MRHAAEFRDPALVRAALDSLRRTVTRPWTLMEVCGGQTHSILRHGLDELLPPEVELVHGPGCPVCVTPLEAIDRAIAIAATPDVVFTSFGDMLRVPGSTTDLLHVRAGGGDVRVVTSPLHAVRIARENPERQVVFFAIGFETTAPANATSVLAARDFGLRNYSVLVSHVRVPPAMRAILSAPGNRVQAFLAAGHVCTVMGCGEYAPIAAEFGVPIVVTGFEPADLVHGIAIAVRRLEECRPGVENAYGRAVTRQGNSAARAILAEVFEECDRTWRGIGPIPGSGWRLRPAFADFDAERRFAVEGIAPLEPAACRSGLVLQGRLRPCDCPAFGRECTPERPLGATMVSSEGACAAWWRYRREGAGGEL